MSGGVCASCVFPSRELVVCATHNVCVCLLRAVYVCLRAVYVCLCVHVCVCVYVCMCVCVCCSRVAPRFMLAAWVGFVAGGELSFVLLPGLENKLYNILKTKVKSTGSYWISKFCY